MLIILCSKYSTADRISLVTPHHYVHLHIQQIKSSFYSHTSGTPLIPCLTEGYTGCQVQSLCQEQFGEEGLL